MAGSARIDGARRDVARSGRNVSGARRAGFRKITRRPPGNKRFESPRRCNPRLGISLSIMLSRDLHDTPPCTLRTVGAPSWPQRDFSGARQGRGPRRAFFARWGARPRSRPERATARKQRRWDIAVALHARESTCLARPVRAALRVEIQALLDRDGKLALAGEQSERRASRRRGRLESAFRCIGCC